MLIKIVITNAGSASPATQFSLPCTSGAGYRHGWQFCCRVRTICLLCSDCRRTKIRTDSEAWPAASFCERCKIQKIEGRCTHKTIDRGKSKPVILYVLNGMYVCGYSCGAGIGGCRLGIVDRAVVPHELLPLLDRSRGLEHHQHLLCI